MNRIFNLHRRIGRAKLVALALLLVFDGWFVYWKLTDSDPAGAGDQGGRAAATTPAGPTRADMRPTASRPTTTEVPRPTAPPTTAPARALTRASTTTAPPTSAPAMPGSMLPNGVAVGALVSFDGAEVRMIGALPTAQARDRLLMFVSAANVQGKPVVNDVVVDTAAPGGDSVRFVGLDPQAFPEGTDDIDPAHAAELDRIATLLNAFPDVSVVVVGRADQRGSSEHNLGIATERADALVEQLVSRGVDASRLAAVGFGELDPAAPGDSDVAHALNRRAEFVVYGLAN